MGVLRCLLSPLVLPLPHASMMRTTAKFEAECRSLHSLYMLRFLQVPIIRRPNLSRCPTRSFWRLRQRLQSRTTWTICSARSSSNLLFLPREEKIRRLLPHLLFLPHLFFVFLREKKEKTKNMAGKEENLAGQKEKQEEQKNQEEQG